MVQVKRENGFYWVCWENDDWTVAEWRDDRWWHPGSEIEVLDEFWEEIDETPIVRKGA